MYSSLCLQTTIKAIKANITVTTTTSRSSSSFLACHWSFYVVVALLFAPTQGQTQTQTHSLTHTFSKLQTERQSLKQDCPVALRTHTKVACMCVYVCTYFLYGFLDIFYGKVGSLSPLLLCCGNPLLKV